MSRKRALLRVKKEEAPVVAQPVLEEKLVKKSSKKSSEKSAVEILETNIDKE